MAVEEKRAASLLLPMITWITRLILAGMPRIR